MKHGLAQQHVVPRHTATQLSIQAVDASTPRGGGLQFSLHVWMGGLLLCLGFHQINRVLCAHQKIGRVKRRQTVFLHVTQAHEIVARFAHLAEGVNLRVSLCPFDERTFQPAIARRKWQPLINTLGNRQRIALAHHQLWDF